MSSVSSAPAMVLLLVWLVLGGWAAPPYPFNDPSLSWDERVQDLVGRLTLDEMTAQMANGGRNQYAPAIPRLGIPPYTWGAECLRGDVGAGSATSFPQAIGLAATFSPEVVFNVSRATSLEVRAKFNNNSQHGDYSLSVSCWSPVINIMRDPRWGRNQETYGEDPYQSGLLAQAFVHGLQGDHPRYVITNAGCKHFDVYGGPENIPESRHRFDAKVSTRDWRMTFLPAFKKCVQAGSYSLMCSYNSIDGIPACANKRLLTDILRGEWGFSGYVVSDEGAIEDILYNHRYTSTPADTAAAAVNAGCNLELPPIVSELPNLFKSISDAVQQGKLTEDTVRNSVKPLFYTRMRLGLFDPPSMNPYNKLNPETFIQSAQHRELSIQTATRSFVLLKNIKNFLPLKRGQKFAKIAIVGPMADNIRAQFGDYTPDPDPTYTQTPWQGLQRLGNSSKLAPGCHNSNTVCSSYDSASVQSAVLGADLVVVCLGTGTNVESESNDRPDINLPGQQLPLLQDAVKYSKGAPVVLLLFNAGPLDVTWAQNTNQVVVIMECFFPAQATGEALRRVFYNDGPGANPGGRLPATWPLTMEKYPAMTNYSMVGRTYRYSMDEPLYPYGYGLSYTTFHYRTLDIRPSQLHYTDSVIIEVYVENTGSLDGEEVVQVYISWTNATVPVPALQLVGFGRYFLPASQGRTCHFKITREQLAVWDDDKGFVTQPGMITVYAGGQQPNQKMVAPSNVLKGSFTIL